VSELGRRLGIFNFLYPYQHDMSTKITQN